MIDVKQIKINVRIPCDKVRVVVLQPFIQFHSNTEEPFRWLDAAVNKQLAAISRTLDIAKNGFAGKVANFTLFPEYAIPGIAGVTIINDRISASDWPNESIIIGGVDGITQYEYKNLCVMLNVQVSPKNTPVLVPEYQWVNCCLIWVKDRHGVVRKWVQPKIRPACPELNVTCSDMFCGSTVYIFEGQYDSNCYPCRFMALTCFDWVVSVAGKSVSEEILEKLTKMRVPTQLDLVFVVQHNPKPNHPSFLTNTHRFLTDKSYPFVERDWAIVLHANTAASLQPSRTGLRGFSACVFSPTVQLEYNGCRPTVCMQPISLRGCDILKRCKDVVFREMGECIHSFTVSVPRFVTPDATGKTLPLPMANVHSAFETEDPRLSGRPVPAAVKWVNDSLDSIRQLSEIALEGCLLKVKAKAIEPAIIGAMRKSDGHAAADTVNWATCSFSRGNVTRNESNHQNADLWGTDEVNALEHVLHSLTSLGLAYRLELVSTQPHGVVQNGEGFVQVVAIRGDTHQDCRFHYNELVPKLGSDPVLVIARDRDNLTPTPEEYLRFDETVGERGFAFLDYQTLISKCRSATDDNILKGYLDGILPKHHRII